MAGAFELRDTQRVQFRIDLPDNDTIKSLLKMTPYYWRAPRDRRTQVEALTRFSTQVDCRLMCFARSR